MLIYCQVIIRAMKKNKEDKDLETYRGECDILVQIV